MTGNRWLVIISWLETCEMHAGTSCLHNIVDILHNYLFQKLLNKHPQTNWVILDVLPYFEGWLLISLHLPRKAFHLCSGVLTGSVVYLAWQHVQKWTWIEDSMLRTTSLIPKLVQILLKVYTKHQISLHADIILWSSTIKNFRMEQLPSNLAQNSIFKGCS